MIDTREKKIDYGEMLKHCGYHIRRAHSYFSRTFNRFGKQYAIKSQQATILTLAKNNPGISPAAIADSNDMERSLMAKLTADLESRGFIQRRQSTTDRRHKGLFVTKAGEKFHNEVMSTFYNEMEPRLTRNLTPTEIKTLIRLLQKVYLD